MRQTDMYILWILFKRKLVMHTLNQQYVLLYLNKNEAILSDICQVSFKFKYDAHNIKYYAKVLNGYIGRILFLSAPQKAWLEDNVSNNLITISIESY